MSQVEQKKPRNRPFDIIYVDWTIKLKRTQNKIDRLKEYDAANCEKEQIKTELKKLNRAFKNYETKIIKFIEGK